MKIVDSSQLTHPARRTKMFAPSAHLIEPRSRMLTLYDRVTHLAEGALVRTRQVVSLPVLSARLVLILIVIVSQFTNK